MNAAHRALLSRLREIVEETPRSGALNAAKRPLHITRFAQAVEARADDGAALVSYAQAKVHEAPTGSYNALVKAGRPDLTVEAVVADRDAPWASVFRDVDREAAVVRLGTMLQQHEADLAAQEAEAVVRDRKIIEQVSARRVAKGKPALSADQVTDMLRDRAAKRADGLR